MPAARNPGTTALGRRSEPGTSNPARILPQTIAYPLTDSPAGQLSWIVDKFHDWVAGPLDEAVTPDKILTNIMLYWLTGTAGSAASLHYENMHAAPSWGRPPSTTPIGVAAFATDVAIRRYREPAARW
jgi:hypothetical protein